VVPDRIQDLITKGMTLEQVKKADPVKGTRAGRLLGFAAVVTSLTPAISLDAAPQARGAQAQVAPAPAPARGRGAQTPAAPETPPTPRAAAPIDLTGYWVSVITEDWRWRMVTAPKGDYTSIPINAEARTVGDAWDPVKDEAAGEQCKAYGAPGLMRIPGRLNITWQDDNTLKVETDAGRQTRLFHFGDWKSPGGDPTPQGDTTAQWETRPGRRGQPLPPPSQRFGNLKTVTTRLRPGYLRKNGVPYSEKTTLTEYWDLHKQTNGDQWLVITNATNAMCVDPAPAASPASAAPPATPARR
jgi:hypothetical protein